MKTNLCDKIGFENFYKHHFKSANNFAFYKCGNSDAALDLVQDSFSKIWENCSKIDFDKAKTYLFTSINNLFLNTIKHQKVVFNYQKEIADKSKNYLMGGSPYSTLTLNYDFRTASHIDKGDLIGSRSTITIFEEIPNNYEGCYLGFPEYKIAVDLKDGDTLIFDAHEYHANTEMRVLTDKLPYDPINKQHHGGRMSVVAYLRNRLSECT